MVGDFDTTLSRPRRKPLPLKKIKTSSRINWFELEEIMWRILQN